MGRPMSQALAAGRSARRAVAGLSDRGWLLLLGGLALAVRLPLIVASGSVSYAGDTAEYMQLADGLLHGRFDTDYRMPGYPLFIDAVGWLPGSRAANVVTVQHLIGVGIVLALFAVGSRWFGRPTGVAAAVLAAVTPIMLGLEHTLQPDFLFGAWVFAGVALLVLGMAAGRPRPWLVVAAGLAFAAGAYVKPVGAAVVAGVAIGLWAGTRSLRDAALGTGIVLAVLSLLLVPWAIRNQAEYGHLTLSTQAGQTLFKRVFDVDRRPVPTDTADGRLVARIQREQRRADPSRELNNYLSEALQQRGYSADEAVAIERRVAVDAIRRDPIAYLAATPSRVSRFLTDLASFSYRDVTGGENSSGIDPNNRSAPVRAAIELWFAAGKALTEIWWILSLHVLAGLMLLLSPYRRARIAAGVLAGTWLSIALATALSHGGLRRYSAQMAPEAWLLGAAGAVLVATLLVQAVRVMRAPPAEP
jgi:hypothetical protein